ncbi:MAG: UvrB/UvrC motif-containing protein [Patescibacteria group bacterium]
MTKDDIDFKTLPDTPGVYRFMSEKGEALYVGKATSLRDRVKSYFGRDIGEVRSPLIAKIVQDATQVEWEETDSVLDALILEAKRIHELSPPGNTDSKDDKSWNWLIVTRERFPRFLVVRERALESAMAPRAVAHRFGPFPRGGALKEALRIVARIFPFFDAPFPVGGALSKSQGKMLRFNQSIGKYPQLDEAPYKKTVRFLVMLFSAKKKSLLASLEREMKRAAKEERFEDAETLKRQLFALQHIRDVTLIKEDLRRPESTTFRIESYDTAHIRGSAPRGVMAVVEDGEAKPAEYRTFTIREAKAGDDFAALEEIIRRRARHPEWPYPKLVVIDGGRAHLTRAKKILAEAGMNTEAVSVVKDKRHRPREILGPSRLTHAHESSILLANSEAHRFAIGRHRRALRRRK